MICPSGENPLGGGEDSVPPAVYLEASYPSTDNDGAPTWNVTVQNTNGISATVTIYATCANVNP